MEGENARLRRSTTLTERLRHAPHKNERKEMQDTT